MNVTDNKQLFIPNSFLIQSWIDDGDVEEQRETGQYLLQVLDEDLPSERKLFPVEMKGITW
ncbi:MAG: hypothetical protein F6K47_20895 [Symploca sp. SIO2E6]|nr:hypothetical protein [Symploca sp. SIO2E6]